MHYHIKCISFVIIQNRFMYFVSFGTDSFGDKTLKLPVYLFKLI